MTVVEHPEVRREIREIFDGYWEKSIYAGENFMKAYKVALDRIQRSPVAYPKADETATKRWILLENFPIRIIYKPTENSIFIYSVSYARRGDRDYWKGRSF